jgi:hypothetical protein
MMAETADPEGGAPALPHPLETVVDRWWDDHFPGSAVAHLTAAWNHAFAAKEELKRRLKEGL